MEKGSKGVLMKRETSTGHEVAQRRSPLAGVREVVAKSAQPVELDALDAKLINLLLEDARMSQRKLAGRLNVSAPTVGERMARLERSGVISGYLAKINWDVLGFSQIVYLAVEGAPDADLGIIMTKLWALPEIEAVTLITGDLDLLVRLRVRDYSHLKELLLESVWGIDGLQGTTTQLAVAEMPPKNFDRDLFSLMLKGTGSDS